MWFHQEACCLWGLGKDVAFRAWGTAQVLVHKELFGQMVVPLRRPF